MPDLVQAADPADLPGSIVALVDRLVSLPGAAAITLGGTRASDGAPSDSDWILGLYYVTSIRALDPAEVRGLGYRGTVSDLGAWGPVSNGGARLEVNGQRVDVHFRDLDVVEGWCTAAEAGKFEVLHQEGFLAGAPTYLVAGELALGRHLVGWDLPRPTYPAALASAARESWRHRAGLALTLAEDAADRGDLPAVAGLVVRASLGAAQARMAQQHAWVLDEQHLLGEAGLAAPVRAVLSTLGDEGGLAVAVERVRALLGLPVVGARRLDAAR